MAFDQALSLCCCSAIDFPIFDPYRLYIMAYGCLSQALRPIIRLAVADFFASCLPAMLFFTMVWPPLLFSFPFLSQSFFSDLDKSRLRDNKLHDNCCYAAVLFFSCYCLLPPNDGLTPPNDSLLPPNNGLLPPNKNESSGTHTEMRAQWLSLRARCALINRRTAKMGIKIKAGGRGMAHFLPAWCECLSLRLCCSP